MVSILDRVAGQRYNQFRPRTVPEFFALQLARRLGDAEAAPHYVELVGERSEEGLLVAYRRTVATSKQGGETLARNFHTALDRTNGSGPDADQVRLLAINVERRTVSASVFMGRHLEYTDKRHLSSVRAKAEGSTVSFIRWLTGNLEIESATMECLPLDDEARRSALHRLTVAVLSDQLLPLSQVPKSDLIPAFGYPEPRSRREVREVIQGIWPILGNDPGVLDAIALGLYVQTERLFSLPN
jgi:hypothetical protein